MSVLIDTDCVSCLFEVEELFRMTRSHLYFCGGAVSGISVSRVWKKIALKLLNRSPSVVFLFPECVARVPVSVGGLGVRLCSRKVVSMFATVRNRPQPSATVRNRPQPFA